MCHFFVFRNSVEKLCVSWALPFVECVAVWDINEFVAHLTEVDTVLITNLINQFMEYAKNGQLESAAAMRRT